jgi:MFS family permease
MTLGAFISSATAGIPSTRFGRRMCLVAACVCCFAANIMMMATENIGALYAGRLIIGLANGYFMTFSQLYLQESSTAELRGVFLTGFNFFVSFGTLIGTIVDWATAKRPDKSAYLIPLGLIYVFPLFIICTIWFIPESPRWLILQGRFEEGVKALEWLRPARHDSRLEANAILAAIEKEKETSSGVGWLDMFSNPVDRRRTTLAVCAVLLQAASGSMFIIGMPSSLSICVIPKPTPSLLMRILTTYSIQSILPLHGQSSRPFRNVQRPLRHFHRRLHRKFLHRRALRQPPRPPHDRSFGMRHPTTHHRRRIPQIAKRKGHREGHRGVNGNIHVQLQRHDINIRLALWR